MGYGFYGYNFSDPYILLGMVLVLIATIFCGIAQSKVNNAYNKYSKIANNEGLSGYDVARRILDNNGMSDMQIYETQGKLSDHYDPTKRTVNLSSDIYHGRSIASVAVAAHECGHAIQHHTGYKAIVFRNAILPLCRIGQSLGWIVIIIGLVSEAFGLAWFGLALMSAILVFQVLTLPIEFNASNRALAILESSFVSQDEVYMSKQMLSAAALTYVAGFAASVASILRILLMILGNSRRRD